MKKSAKILITAALAAVLSLGSFAAGKMIDITVDPTVKIKVNGAEFKPKDANGNDVMTFIYNGTTYAPLRALAEAYGLEVGYDAAANMATVDEPGKKQTAATADGAVLYDKNGITITAKGLSDEFLGTALKLNIRNNTGKSITVQARSTSVNGYMIDPLLSADVASGKQANATMTFMSSNLSDNDITKIIEIETSFHIVATDSWDIIVDTDPVKINFN